MSVPGRLSGAFRRKVHEVWKIQIFQVRTDSEASLRSRGFRRQFTADFQAQHLVDGAAGDVFNALPVLLGHGVAGDHPAAAARDDLGEGQILVQILFVDAPSAGR